MANADTLRKAKYEQEFCRCYRIKINRKTESDILQKLESQHSVQGYIKSLIRKDIAEHSETKEA